MVALLTSSLTTFLLSALLNILDQLSTAREYRISLLQKTDQHIVHLTTLTHLLLRDLIQGSAMEEAGINFQDQLEINQREVTLQGFFSTAPNQICVIFASALISTNLGGRTRKHSSSIKALN